MDLLSQSKKNLLCVYMNRILDQKWIGSLIRSLFYKEELNESADRVLSGISDNLGLRNALSYLWGDLGQPPKVVSF